MYPDTPATAKNNIIFINTKITLTLASLKLVTIVNAIMPNISSIKAAPNIAFPVLLLSLPSSFKVSTVILTDVAVNIIPINIFSINSFPAILANSPLLKI